MRSATPSPTATVSPVYLAARQAAGYEYLMAVILVSAIPITPDGLRTSKTVNGAVTKYHAMNGTLLGQTKGSDTIVFLYDEKGNKYGFDYNGTKYYYIFNVQGDVIGILNQSG